MKKYRNIIFYISTIGVFSVLMYWIVQQGKSFEAGRSVVMPVSESSPWTEFVNSLTHNFHYPLAILLVQIVTIIFAARIFGWVFKKIRQPAVIGEIVAGIVLGPSLMGAWFPEFSSLLFPAQSLGNLQFLSQIGLILFMFVVGMELDLKTLSHRANDAVVISHASIIIPFALGMWLAYFIYELHAPVGVRFISFGLFLGIAMSITAFPVLARIVQERGIHRSHLGTVVITCAAADDITAWCLLAAIIAIVKAGTFVSSLYVILLAVAYVLIMMKVVRPFLKRVGDLHATRENLSKQVVAIFFLTLLLSAYATEIIGIHALFGAFMAGAIMPDNQKFRDIFIQKVEDVAVVLLLPLFFVYTGLRTQIGLLNDVALWEICGIIILVAVAGKFVGSAFAARFVGQSWRDSLTIGALMNTRGLMELVVLNIGYDLGVMTPEVFAMMVIMALVTTFMTGPALDLIDRLFRHKEAPAKEDAAVLSKFRILISFGNPEMGRSLLRLAHSLVRKFNGDAAITAMHLSPSNVLHHYNMEEYEQDSFAPVIAESAELNLPVTTLFKPSADIDSDIAEMANNGHFDLLLVGIGKSIFEGSLLGKILGYTTRIVNPDRLLHKVTGREKLFENSPFDERTRQILVKSEISVGILIDKNLQQTGAVILPVLGSHDAFLFSYARKFIENASAQVTVCNLAVDEHEGMAQLNEAAAAVGQSAPGKIVWTDAEHIEKSFLQQQDLLLVSLESWKKLVDRQSIWLNHSPSILILKP